MATIEVEATCDYCRADLICPECDYIRDPEPTYTPSPQPARPTLHPEVRRSIIRMHNCPCVQHQSTWHLCPYHLGMADALDGFREHG